MQKRSFITKFSPLLLSDSDILELFEEQIKKNCVVDRHGDIVYTHRKTQYYNQLKEEILRRMLNESKKTRRNNKDIPPSERRESEKDLKRQ